MVNNLTKSLARKTRRSDIRIVLKNCTRLTARNVVLSTCKQIHHRIGHVHYRSIVEKKLVMMDPRFRLAAKTILFRRNDNILSYVNQMTGKWKLPIFHISLKLMLKTSIGFIDFYKYSFILVRYR